MASSLASIAETWPENVLPQWQQKMSSAENICSSFHIFVFFRLSAFFRNFFWVRMDFPHEVRFYAGIGPAHFPAETTRPLGRGCLPFSPSFSRCKVTKRIFGTVTFCHYLSPFVTFQQIAFSRCKVTEKKIVTVQLCPAMSICVHLCPATA